MKKPVVLMILDGWGLGENVPTNAIYAARTPHWDELWQNYPHSTLLACGEEVGLPCGQQGNSEVGHLTLGAGRVIDQDLSKINKAVRQGTFAQNEAFLAVMDGCIARQKPLHVLGLLSPGGVHSHMDHVLALVEMAKARGVAEIYLHGFLDGRDVGPKTAAGFIDEIQRRLKEIAAGEIATLCGRYYAMDRDKRWERVEKAYRALVYSEGIKATSAQEALAQSAETDEFVLPTVITRPDGAPVAAIGDGDGVIFANFRADRAREISRCFVDRGQVPFATADLAVDFCAMTQYYEGINARIAYPPLAVENTLGQVLSGAGLKQLRLAETEKYAHVTFFFNGGVEVANENEARILVPSPKVATYDLQPEMSAPEVNAQLLAAIESGAYDFILVNYANPDMVGHTGALAQAVQAVEVVDDFIGQAAQAVLAREGALLITADHGNAEKMYDAVKDAPHTAHTENKVPFVLVADGARAVRDGALRDVAPTVLALLGLAKPAEMTGQSLLMAL